MSDTDNKRGKIAPEHIEEARRLNAIWHRELPRRQADDVESQAKFGERYGIGNQAAVGFFLNGKTALSIKAAAGFARGLGCTIDDFSPRLAEELRIQARHLRTADAAGTQETPKATALPFGITLHEATRIFADACTRADPLRFKLAITALEQAHTHPEMLGDVHEQLVTLLSATPGKARAQG